MFVLFLLLCVVCLMAFMAYKAYTDFAKARARVKDVVVDGIYAFDDADPFEGEDGYRKVLEIRAGWVKYTYGPNSPIGGTMPLDRFASIYRRVK